MFTEEVANNLDSMLNALCNYIDAVSEDDETREFIALSCSSKFIMYSLSEKGSDFAYFNTDDVIDRATIVADLCIGDYYGYEDE